MKWTDEEIDQLFQDASAKVEVPYQDSYWQEMEALLPKKSTKKGFWWIFGVLFALIGLTSTVFIFSSKNSSSDTSLQANLKKEQLNESQQKELDQTLVMKTELNEQDSKVENQLRGVEKKNNESGHLPENNANSNNFNQIQQSNQTVKSGNKSAVVNQQNNRLGKVEKEKKSEQASSVLRTDSKSSTKNTNSSREPKKGISNTFIPNENPKNQIVKNQNKEIEKNLKIVPNNGNVVENEFSNQLEGDQEKIFAEQTIVDSAADSQTKLLVEKESIHEESKDSIVKSKLNEPLPGSKSLQKEIQQPVPAKSYYIQAGTRFSQSYLKTPQDQMMAGVILGIGYQYIKPKFGYSIGLNAISSFVNNIEIVRKSRVYGFGVTEYQQNLKYKQLTYLELPVYLNYIHKRNTFSIGFAPTYLASTMMKFEEWEAVEMINERNYYGQKIGLKSVGLNAMFGYQYTVKNNWSIGVNIGLTLMQQIDGNQFVQESVDLPFYGQITLRKTLIPKK